MKNLLLFLITLSFLSLSCGPREVPNRLYIGIPTIAQEANSIWRTINDIEFLEGQGYKVFLPEHELIDSLIAKSKNKTFGDDDMPQIYRLLEAVIYAPEDYAAALGKVKAQQDFIKGIINELTMAAPGWDWKFTFFEQYTIVFTRYGTGGSYDPDNGIVTLLTTPDGAFMNYDIPAITIIHEIVHMGMEQSIVQKYQLPHGTKERLVDRFVDVMFGDVLSNYKVQNMGDQGIDSLLKSKDDFSRLDEIIEQYVEQRKE